MKWWSKIEQNFYSCSRFGNIPDYYTKWQLWNLHEIVQAALDRRKMWQLCLEALLQSSSEPRSSRTAPAVCLIEQLWKQLRPMVANKNSSEAPGSRSRSFTTLFGRLNETALTTRNFGSSEIWLTYTQFLTLFYQMKNKFDNFYVKFYTH